MNGNDILRELGNTDEGFVLEAAPGARRRPRMRRVLAAAACLAVLAAGAGFGLRQADRAETPPTESAGGDGCTQPAEIGTRTLTAGEAAAMIDGRRRTEGGAETLAYETVWLPDASFLPDGGREETDLPGYTYVNMGKAPDAPELQEFMETLTRRVSEALGVELLNVEVRDGANGWPEGTSGTGDRFAGKAGDYRVLGIQIGTGEADVFSLSRQDGGISLAGVPVEVDQRLRDEEIAAGLRGDLRENAEIITGLREHIGELERELREAEESRANAEREALEAEKARIQAEVEAQADRLESLRRELEQVFDADLPDVKVVRDYDGLSEHGARRLDVYLYDESAHLLNRYLDEPVGDYIRLSFDNAENRAGDTVSDGMLREVTVLYSRSRVEPGAGYCETDYGPLIGLDRAEECLRRGWVFGGHSCPLCVAERDGVSFDGYDAWELTYVRGWDEDGDPTGALPFYAFYKKIGTAENGNDVYAKGYVPAVEVEGMEEFFRGQRVGHPGGG